MNILISLTGFLMAMADTMPGLSGGTICFIMGFYDQFLTSIKNLLHKETRKQAILFLVKMGVGWLVGLVVGVLVISKLLQNYPYMMISFFLGLVLVSIPITFKEETKHLKHLPDLIFLAIGLIIVVALSSFGSGLNLDFSTSIPLWFYAYTFVVAMIAISAMLLPGISGSTVLLIFGIYTVIINNLKALLTDFNFAAFSLLVVFGLGIIVGAFSISKVISNAFKHHPGKVLYFIMGLMIGSLYAIYISAPLLGKDSGDVIAPFSMSNFNIIAFIIGICAIICIEFIKNILNKRG